MIVDALCGAIVTLALATSSPQLEVLAVEAQRLMQANVSDLSSLLETIRLAA